MSLSRDLRELAGRCALPIEDVRLILAAADELEVNAASIRTWQRLREEERKRNRHRAAWSRQSEEGTIGDQGEP